MVLTLAFLTSGTAYAGAKIYKRLRKRRSLAALPVTVNAPTATTRK
jgi:hypothetical protein